MPSQKMKMKTIKIPAQPSIKRSPSWPKVRRDHLKKQPSCQACGTTNNLAVHHIVPLHVNRSKELDPSNLITLCENIRSAFCHYTFGHLNNWWKWDPNVIADAADHLYAVNFANNTQDNRGRQKHPDKAESTMI